MQSQNVILERDMWKRDSLNVRRREPKSSDYNRQKGINFVEQNFQVKFSWQDYLNSWYYYICLKFTLHYCISMSCIFPLILLSISGSVFWYNFLYGTQFVSNMAAQIKKNHCFNFQNTILACWASYWLAYAISLNTEVT